jgi:hypothetical protein
MPAPSQLDDYYPIGGEEQCARSQTNLFPSGLPRDTGMKCGGRKSYLERNPAAVALAKKLVRYPVNGHRRSLRDVAAELEAQGHLSATGTR